jgi:hypothetical protein
VKIKRLGAIVIVVCMLCAYMHIMCIFSRDFIKCLECTCKSISCDRNFSEANFDRLSKEKVKLKAA